MKVVINRCFGGFGLSTAAEALYKERKGVTDPNWYYYDLERDDPVLVQVVEELGDEANTPYSDLHIVEIPDGISWFIHEYDGLEHIAESHRTWS